MPTGPPMKLPPALAVLLVMLAPAARTTDAPASQALGGFAWSLSDALPPVACRGRDAGLDAAAAALFADPRMAVIRAWLERARLPLPPPAPAGDWPVARCLAAVQESHDLLDANAEPIERMAAELRSRD